MSKVERWLKTVSKAVFESYEGLRASTSARAELARALKALADKMARDAAEIAIHRGRVTIYPEDVELAYLKLIEGMPKDVLFKVVDRLASPKRR